MDSKRLRTLLAIADHGSFGRAAAAIGLSQPSLSRQIAILEEEASAALLYRNGRGASLTPEGQRLIDAARPLVAALDNLPAVLTDDEPHGQIVLGMPTFLSAHMARAIFDELARRYPRLRVRLVDGFSGFISEWLLEGRLDIAVVYDARRSHAINAEPLANEELFLFAARGVAERSFASGAIAASGAVSLAAASGLRLILPGGEHGLRRALHRAGVRPEPSHILEIDSLTAIRTLVREGLGWSILPRAALFPDNDTSLIIRLLGEPQLRARLMLAYGANRPITPAFRALTAFMREQFDDLRERGIMSPIRR